MIFLLGYDRLFYPLLYIDSGGCHPASEEGLESALNRRKQQKRRCKIIEGEKEAYLIAIACSETPTGKSHWTIKMLADKMVELNYVEQVSTETIRQTLKKTNLNLGLMNPG